MRTHDGRRVVPNHPITTQPEKAPQGARTIGYPGGLFALLWKGGKPSNNRRIALRTQRWRSPKRQISQTCWSPWATRSDGSVATIPPKRWTACASKTAALGFVTQSASAETPSPSSSGSAARVSKRQWSICWPTMAGRGTSLPHKSRHRSRSRTRSHLPPLSCRLQIRINGACSPICKKGASRPR